MYYKRIGVRKYVIGFLGTLSMLDCNIFPGLGRDYLGPEVNMFLLPMQELEEDNLTKAGHCVSMQHRPIQFPSLALWDTEFNICICFRFGHIPSVLSAARL